MFRILPPVCACLAAMLAFVVPAAAENGQWLPLRESAWSDSHSGAEATIVLGQAYRDGLMRRVWHRVDIDFSPGKGLDWRARSVGPRAEDRTTFSMAFGIGAESATSSDASLRYMLSGLDETWIVRAADASPGWEFGLRMEMVGGSDLSTATQFGASGTAWQVGLFLAPGFQWYQPLAEDFGVRVSGQTMLALASNIEPLGGMTDTRQALPVYSVGADLLWTSGETAWYVGASMRSMGRDFEREIDLANDPRNALEPGYFSAHIGVSELRGGLPNHDFQIEWGTAAGEHFVLFRCRWGADF